MRLGVYVTLSLLSLLFPVVDSSAQETGDDSLFFDRVDVNVVNVEVFVTDRNGDRVMDLTKEDFVILEDGKPLEISNFYAVNRSHRPATDSEPTVDRQDTEDSPPESEPPPLPANRPLNLLVYVDHFNITPSNRKRVLDQLDGLLENRLTQGDKIMLVGFDGKTRVIQDFTGDLEKVRQGLGKMGKAQTNRLHQEADRRRTQSLMLASLEDTGDLSTAHSHLRGFIQSVRADLRRSAQSLDYAVRFLGGLPGRKALLYVSDGLPKRPGEDLYRQLLDLAGNAAFTANLASRMGILHPDLEALSENEGPLYDSITRNANAHQVTFYTLDARGTVGASSLSAAEPNMAFGSGGNAGLNAIRTLNYQEPLIEMAEATGGSAILNTFNYETAFTKVANDFDNFYSLGFTTTRGDGKYHEIEVKVRQPGLRIRHRQGYVDKPIEERLKDRTLSSLIFDLEKNPLGVEIDLGEPKKKSKGRYQIPILVRIPFREVMLLANGRNEEGRLAIFLVTKDDSGGVSDLHRIPYPVKIPSEQVAEARQREIGYTTDLVVRRGALEIAVGVFDEISGVESFVREKVTVGEVRGKKGKRKSDETQGRRGQISN